MEFKELLKKYWFIGLIALTALVYLLIYSVQAFMNRPIYVNTKTDGDGKYIVYSIEDDDLLADDFYETLYNDLGTYTAYIKWSREVANKAVKTTDQLNTYATNYANYINYNNEKSAIDSALKQSGYANGYDDLFNYCLDVVKTQELYKEFYTKNFDIYAPNVINDNHPKKVYHILIKLENVQDTTDESGNSVKIANPSEEEEARLAEVLLALQNGEDFKEVAKKYSDDGSASEGGYLGIYDDQTIASQMVKEFADAVIALGYDEVSDPVVSEYGYHIIMTERPSNDELKEDAAFMEQISNYYQYTNILAMKEKADELGFEIKDEKFAELINDYVKQAESEITVEESGVENNEAESEGEE